MSFNRILSITIAILFIALFAQLSIDLPIGQTMIPITGQTFAVLLVAYFLGAIWGTTAVALYVLAGLIGLPVFADGKAGMAVLIGGSGGYLIGFIAGAWSVGWLKNSIKQASFWKISGLMGLGTLVILIFGVGRLIQLYGMEKGLAYGFYPFWRGAVVKVFLGAFVVWGYEKRRFYLQRTM